MPILFSGEKDTGISFVQLSCKWIIYRVVIASKNNKKILCFCLSPSRFISYNNVNIVIILHSLSYFLAVLFTGSVVELVIKLIILLAIIT